MNYCLFDHWTNMTHWNTDYESAQWLTDQQQHFRIIYLYICLIFNGDTTWLFPFGGVKGIGGCEEESGVGFWFIWRPTYSPQVHSINSCVSENCKDVRHEWDTEQTDSDSQQLLWTQDNLRLRVKIWRAERDKTDTFLFLVRKLHIGSDELHNMFYTCTSPPIHSEASHL